MLPSHYGARRKFRSIRLALSAGPLGARPAQAAVTYTFTGAITDGFDETGVFGLAGQDLAGRGFTATFVRQDLPGATYVHEPNDTGIAGFGLFLGGGYYPAFRWNFVWPTHDFKSFGPGPLTQFTIGFNY